MTGALGPTHWAIIAVVVLVLFGAKRLPDAARGLGKSMRIFKAETTALTESNEREPSSGTTDGEHAETPTTASASATPAGPARTIGGAASAAPDGATPTSTVTT